VRTQNPAGASSLQRALAYLTVFCIIVSFAAITAIIVAYALGAASDGRLSHGFWPAVVATPMIGFPLGLLLMMALLWISSAAHKKRANVQS
jgi:hypothetical protein